MVFKDVKTMQSFEVSEAVEKFCKSMRCSDCPVIEYSDLAEMNCVGWAHNHPIKAAKIMGYEVIREK